MKRITDAGKQLDDEACSIAQETYLCSRIKECQLAQRRRKEKGRNYVV